MFHFWANTVLQDSAPDLYGTLLAQTACNEFTFLYDQSCVPSNNYMLRRVRLLSGALWSALEKYGLCSLGASPNCKGAFG
jgi:hypothetical protein